jgi:hypothetical protein
MCDDTHLSCDAEGRSSLLDLLNVSSELTKCIPCDTSGTHT